MARVHNRENLMNYNELVQLYFERSNAMQQYWNLYVIIVGGVLAFSSLRKQPAAITTALVCILFALFAYKNLDAMKDTTAQRFATIEAIKQFDSGGAAATARSKCAICSSRLLRPPRSEASRLPTSSAICLRSPHFARWSFEEDG